MDMTLNQTSLTFNLLGGEEQLEFTLQSPSFLGADIYNGATQIDPNFTKQTLNTAHKVINKNITINPIQVETVSNTSGGATVYIGGII